MFYKKIYKCLAVFMTFILLNLPTFLLLQYVSSALRITKVEVAVQSATRS